MSPSSTSSSPRSSRATVTRLLRQEANDSDTGVNIDGESGQGAEDEVETAPRRRNHGELRELVEGVDYDLTDLHEPDLRVRDHPPPPELLYESFEDAI
ncbi:hypothetical protein E4U33_000631 [Claviceps sp. LM78 group G4]|nr:hypothetical protein E4U33_000631 [Claviceps sp. LM78 group G4]